MPRIRTIKPEFCTSEQAAECSTTARLLFVCMWCFCDDAGRHPASVRRLKMECFPGDDFTLDEMTAYVNELHAAGLLVEYHHEGQQFWQVTGWKHQKIDKPNYKFGPLDASGKPAKFADHSTTVRRPFDDSSPPEGSLREGKGMEGKGMEGSGVDDKSPTPTSMPPLSGVLMLVSKQSSVQRNPPSADEVRRYMADQGYADDADAFVDFYGANGWVQGRGKPIKDWKAAVRNWQRNDFGKPQQRNKPTPKTFEELGT